MVRDTNAYQYTSSGYDNSPGDAHRRTEEFEGKDVDRQLIRRTTNDAIEDVEVIVRNMPSDQIQEYYDDDEQNFANGYNTNVRAIQREDIKVEKQTLLKRMEQQYKDEQQKMHKVKLDKIAGRTKQRTLPYGLNYSKVKDSIENVEVTEPKTRKVDKEQFKSLINDKNGRYDYTQTVDKKSKVNNNQDRIKFLTNERLGRMNPDQLVSLQLYNFDTFSKPNITMRIARISSVHLRIQRKMQPRSPNVYMKLSSTGYKR